MGVREREQRGAYRHLVAELQGDGERFRRYLRSTRELSAQLFLVGVDLEKQSVVVVPRGT